MFTTKHFLMALVSFMGLTICLYLFIIFFNGTVPFNKEIYETQSHHYFSDPRIHNEEFNFLRGLGVWDAQWYLRIAHGGYPKDLYQYMGALTYAFFPLYPLILYLVNYLFHNIELTAFFVTNILLLANFFSLYYVGTKLYSRTIALRGTLLLYLFPFSLFYWSYYTEGIFLLLLIWFSYFLIKKRWFLSAIFLSLLFVTRPNGPFLGLVFLFFLYKAIRKKTLSWRKAFLWIIVTPLLFLGWLYFCYVMTGKPFYWHEVQAIWYDPASIGASLVHNISTILSFYSLPFHTFRESRIDVLVIVTTVFLLIKSKKMLKPELWFISLLLCIIPLLFRDTMSYSRYQSISFPLFLYLGSILAGWKFGAVSIIFVVLLFVASLYFVNWHWVG